MINPLFGQGSAVRKLLGSPRKRLLVGTALAVIASGTLIGGEAILTSPSAQAAAATENSTQPAQAPDFADLAQKVSPAVVSILGTLLTPSQLIAELHSASIGRPDRFAQHRPETAGLQFVECGRGCPAGRRDEVSQNGRMVAALLGEGRAAFERLL